MGFPLRYHKFMGKGSSIIAVAIVAAVTGTSMSAQSVSAQVSAQSVSAQSASAQSIARRRPSIVTQSFSWEGLFKLLAPQRRSGASRDVAPCILSMSPLPNVPNRVVTTKPTLVWRGDATAVGLRRLGEARPFWKQTLSAQSTDSPQRIQYNGPLLEADIEYQWVVYGSIAKAYADFQVMNEADRSDVMMQLDELKGKDEATLQKRLAIYSNANLTSDALEEVFAQRNPSRELRRSIQSMPTDWCPKPETASRSIPQKPSL
jgi:hypothetical protein